MTTFLVRPFAVISGAQVHRARDGCEKQLVELVEATNRLQAVSETVNPASYFPPTLSTAMRRIPELVGCQAKGAEGNPPK
jgi:hypothetical protein